MNIKAFQHEDFVYIFGGNQLTVGTQKGSVEGQT